MPVSKSKRASNDRYKEKHYQTFTVTTIDRDIVLTFRDVCRDNGISQASVVRQAMLDTIEKYR